MPRCSIPLVLVPLMAGAWSIALASPPAPGTPTAPSTPTAPTAPSHVSNETDRDGRTFTRAAIGDGTFKAMFGGGYAPEVEPKLLEIRASVDRSTETLTFTLPGGGSHEVKIASRAQDRWQGNCATSTSYVLSEVADTEPANVELEGVTFEGATLTAVCRSTRFALESADKKMRLVFEAAAAAPAPAPAPAPEPDPEPEPEPAPHEPEPGED